MHNLNIFILPFVLEDFIQSSHQLFYCHIMNTQFLCNATGHQAVYVVPLVPKKWEHQHGYGIADTLVDAMGASMSHKDPSLGMC